MKKTSFSIAVAALLLAAPLAANAAEITLNCNVGQFRIVDAKFLGAPKATFRNNIYSERETLCEPKLNAFCAMDASDPNYVRLTWTMRDRGDPAGAVRLQYSYVVDTVGGKVTTSMRDRYGSMMSDASAVACRAGDDKVAAREQRLAELTRWPLRVIAD